MPRKREDCWMTFTEALEMYLANRDMLHHFGPGANLDEAKANMQLAAEHMDALTSEQS